jgi:hypothetical protein
MTPQANNNNRKKKHLRMSNQKGSATKIVQDFAVLRAAGSAWLRETKDKKNSQSSFF